MNMVLGKNTTLKKARDQTFDRDLSLVNKMGERTTYPINYNFIEKIFTVS